MATCIRCRNALSNPDANYCGNCSFPNLNGYSEEEVRVRAREELTGFLEGFDVRTIQDTKSGNQEEPNEPYQWYLEEGVKKAFLDIAYLQRWDWFDEGPVSGLFFQENLFNDNPSEEAITDYMLWASVSAFIYEAFQPAGLEFSVQIGALIAEELDSVEDIEVSISVNSDEEDSDISGAAS